MLIAVWPKPEDLRQFKPRVKILAQYSLKSQQVKEQAGYDACCTNGIQEAGTLRGFVSLAEEFSNAMDDNARMPLRTSKLAP